MTLEGFEELRFAPNWRDEDHNDFWSLVMSWNIKTNVELPLNVLQSNLENYFDGLMKPNHWAQEFPEPKAEFLESEQSKTEKTFTGKLTFFDGLHTGKVLTTYILGRQIFCEDTKKPIVIFKISSKAFNEPIWDKLNDINVKENICDD
ncbi:hypothetical protein [Winogradskyella sp. R77965]|uniref:hypothetical protein n=1 Tax=Winogradskyella sp. R77965 TaxID=3093872 RepID=UPI0037DCE007